MNSYREGRKRSVDPLKYLEQREMQYVQAIERLADSGTPADAIKLKALLALHKKIRPDRSVTEIGLERAPWKELLDRIGSDKPQSE